MSFRKKMILFLFMFIIYSFLYFTVPIKKVIIIGTNIDKNSFLNKKTYQINSNLVRNLLIKDEGIKYVKIIRPFIGILFVFTSKKNITAYFFENNSLKAVDTYGNIFKTKDINRNLTVFLGNREKIIEGIYLKKTIKDIDTIFLKDDSPATKKDGFVILWGNEDYEKKEKIINKIEKKINDKGVIDMRFKNFIFFTKEGK